MSTVSLEAILGAKERIRSHVLETYLRPSPSLQAALGMKAPVFLKTEMLQKTGSFKVRGAVNKVLSLVEAGKKPAHLVAASAGNHAQAVAYIGQVLNIPATIVMPQNTPLIKSASTAEWGAKVVLHGALYDDAYNRALEILEATPGAVYIHAYADDDIIIGQGTIGAEIHEQLKEFAINDSHIQVVVPVGGGGLISGVATALKALRPEAKIFGVVSEAAPAMAESFKAGKVVKAKGRPRTLAEGLAVKTVSDLTFAHIKAKVDEMAVVDDDQVASAISFLIEKTKLVAEGAGAAGVAAAMAKLLKLDPNVPTVFVLCGGNIDLSRLAQVVDRSLVAEKRWWPIGVIIDDQPGELAKVSSLIAEKRGNIMEVTHDRLTQEVEVGQTMLRYRVETRGLEHSREIASHLKQHGYEIKETTNE
jgi:threonine dehydratase